MSLQPIVELKNASLGYSDQKLISELDFKLMPGEFVAIVGPNGSGKTTLMKSILGILPLLSGSRALFGQEEPKPNSLSSKIAYIPQRMSINRSVPLTVREFFSLKRGRNFTDSEFVNLLKNLEIEGLEKNSIHKLSGGQLQRVYMAFALLGNPSLICLDEATEGLDVKAQKNFFDILKRIIDVRRASLLMISHDISAVMEQATRVVCINRAILYDGDPSSPSFHSCLHKIYGEESLIHAHHSNH